MNTTLSEFHILLIEDSRADAKIIERALHEGEISHRLTVIPDGRHALDYLFGLRDEPATTVHEPDLILLDLNLPGIDGCQVLTQIKSDPYLRIIPVIVLTTSHARRGHPRRPTRPEPTPTSPSPPSTPDIASWSRPCAITGSTRP